MKRDEEKVGKGRSIFIYTKLITSDLATNHERTRLPSKNGFAFTQRRLGVWEGSPKKRSAWHKNTVFPVCETLP